MTRDELSVSSGFGSSQVKFPGELLWSRQEKNAVLPRLSVREAGVTVTLGDPMLQKINKLTENAHNRIMTILTTSLLQVIHQHTTSQSDCSKRVNSLCIVSSTVQLEILVDKILANVPDFAFGD